jgi:hypothetical protein
MASEVHLLVGIVRWIATKTPEIRSLVMVAIPKIRRFHHATIDIGNRKVFESRRHGRLTVPAGKGTARDKGKR